MAIPTVEVTTYLNALNALERVERERDRLRERVTALERAVMAVPEWLENSCPGCGRGWVVIGPHSLHEPGCALAVAKRLLEEVNVDMPNP